MLPEQYQIEIKSITQQIAEKFHPVKIVLFGSCATGNIREGSDIDLLIIQKENGRRVDRIYKVLKEVDSELPFEPFVYTLDEIDERLRIGDSFVQHILKTGKVIYEQSSPD